MLRATTQALIDQVLLFFRTTNWKEVGEDTSVYGGILLAVTLAIGALYAALAFPQQFQNLAAGTLNVPIGVWNWLASIQGKIWSSIFTYQSKMSCRIAEQLFKAYAHFEALSEEPALQEFESEVAEEN